MRNLNLPAQTRLYTNETYKPHINGVKVAFAAKHPAMLVPEVASPEARAHIDLSRMPSGSVVVLSSAYAGGLQGLQMQIQVLREKYGYDLQPLPNALFESTLVPLLPDIMEEPGTHQNPLAWLLRYVPQHFQTEVFVVK